MAYYTGNVICKDLFAKIKEHATAIQPGEAAPWWTAIDVTNPITIDVEWNSAAGTGRDRDIMALRGTAPDGTSVFDIGFRIPADANMAPNVCFEVKVGQYAPGANPTTTGTWTGYQNVHAGFMFAGSRTNYSKWRANYHLFVNKYNIVLYVEGDQFSDATYWRQSLIWAGIPETVDPNDKSAGSLGVLSTHTVSAGGYPVAKNKVGVGIWYYIQTPGAMFRPIGWDGQYRFGPIHIGNDTEGLRATISNVVLAYGDGVGSDFLNGDSIMINGQQYIVFRANRVDTIDAATTAATKYYNNQFAWDSGRCLAVKTDTFNYHPWIAVKK